MTARVRHGRLAALRWVAVLLTIHLLMGSQCDGGDDDDDDDSTGVADDDDSTDSDDDTQADDDTTEAEWEDVLPAVDPEGDSGHPSVDLMRYQYRHDGGALELRAWSWTPFDDGDGDLTLRLCLRDPGRAYCLVQDNVTPVPAATQLWMTRDDLAIWARLDAPATLAMDPDEAYSLALGLDLADTELEGCALEGAAEVVDSGGAGDAAPDSLWTSGLWTPFALTDVLLFSLDGVTVADGAGGDGDGIIDPGETVSLGVTVSNTGCGPSAGPALVGELRLEPTSTAPASVPVASVSFAGGGSLGPGESSAGEDGLELVVDVAAESGQELHLSLDLADAEGAQATLSLPPLVVGYPAQVATTELLADGQDAASPFDIASLSYAITWTELQLRVASHQPHGADQEVDVLLDVDTDGRPDHLLSTYDTLTGAMTGAHYRAGDGAWIRRGPLASLDYDPGTSHALLGIELADVDRPGFAWAQAVSVDPASLATDRAPDDPADPDALGAIDCLARPWITLAGDELTEQSGDGDTFAEPGETWALDLALANRATVAAPSTSALLGSSSADVQVTSPELTFGDLAAGGQGWSAGAAILSIDPAADASVPHELLLSVDAGGTPVQLSWSLLLGPRPVDLAVDAPPLSEGGSWYGDLALMADDWRDTPGCTGSTAAGRDGIYLLALDAGQAVTAHLEYAPGVQDAVLYIGSDPADPVGSCLVGADDRADESETLFWVAPEAGSYALVVDGLHEGFGGQYVLTLSY